MENQTVQEIENKKRFLRRYKKNLACIGRLEEKLISLDERIKSVKSPNYSGMPRGGTPVSTEELLSDKIDLKKRIGRLKNKGKRLKEEILDEIDSLDDPRYSEVLESYFIDGLTIAQIAEKEGYSERHIYTLYSEAVEALSVMEQ